MIAWAGRIFRIWKNNQKIFDALGGSAPAAWASPDCDDAVLPLHKNVKVSVPVIPRHHTRPAPLGAGLAQGGRSLKIRVYKLPVPRHRIGKFGMSGEIPFAGSGSPSETPGPEEWSDPRDTLIPENATLIHTVWVIFTSVQHPRYLALFGHKNRVWARIQVALNRRPVLGIGFSGRWDRHDITLCGSVDALNY